MILEKERKRLIRNKFFSLKLELYKIKIFLKLIMDNYIYIYYTF